MEETPQPPLYRWGLDGLWLEETTARASISPIPARVEAYFGVNSIPPLEEDSTQMTKRREVAWDRARRSDGRIFG